VNLTAEQRRRLLGKNKEIFTFCDYVNSIWADYNSPIRDFVEFHDFINYPQGEDWETIEHFYHGLNQEMTDTAKELWDSYVKVIEKVTPDDWRKSNENDVEYANRRTWLLRDISNR
jgi:hypothetical protein